MDGVIALYKERGMTSHDCISRLRKILHTKKLGILAHLILMLTVFCLYVLDKQLKLVNC